MNEFLRVIQKITDDFELGIIGEVEDLDELDEVLPPMEDMSLQTIVEMSLNPLFKEVNNYGFCKKGIKSKDWLKKDKYTKLEERLILSSL